MLEASLTTPKQLTLATPLPWGLTVWRWTPSDEATQPSTSFLTNAIEGEVLRSACVMQSVVVRRPFALSPHELTVRLCHHRPTFYQHTQSRCKGWIFTRDGRMEGNKKNPAMPRRKGKNILPGEARPLAHLATHILCLASLQQLCAAVFMFFWMHRNILNRCS